jgi:phage shock protein PspC (stress-responsive transcriptional regulator)
MGDSASSRPKLRRIKGRHWLGGVCAGLGYWLGAPTWLLRVVWTVLLLCYGVGGIVYVLLWIFMPVWETVPTDYEERAGG